MSVGCRNTVPESEKENRKGMSRKSGALWLWSRRRRPEWIDVVLGSRCLACFRFRPRAAKVGSKITSIKADNNVSHQYV